MLEQGRANTLKQNTLKANINFAYTIKVRQLEHKPVPLIYYQTQELGLNVKTSLVNLVYTYLSTLNLLKRDYTQ